MFYWGAVLTVKVRTTAGRGLKSLYSKSSSVSSSSRSLFISDLQSLENELESSHLTPDKSFRTSLFCEDCGGLSCGSKLLDRGEQVEDEIVGEPIEELLLFFT